jgi:hypothetical protein
LDVVIEMVKVKLKVTVTPEIFKWVDEEVDKGHFAEVTQCNTPYRKCRNS